MQQLQYERVTEWQGGRVNLIKHVLHWLPRVFLIRFYFSTIYLPKIIQFYFNMIHIDIKRWDISVWTKNGRLQGHTIPSILPGTVLANCNNRCRWGDAAAAELSPSSVYGHSNNWAGTDKNHEGDVKAVCFESVTRVTDAHRAVAAVLWSVQSVSLHHPVHKVLLFSCQTGRRSLVKVQVIVRISPSC